MSTSVKLSELVDAYDWVSVDGPFENLAYVSRDSGKIWLVTDFDDGGGDEPPEDILDESKYLSVPSKRELDLGRNLALRFADEALPNEYERVKGFFAKSGAYGRFKDLLDERGRLEDWYAYEAAGVREALREWATENEVEIVEESQ